MISLEGDTTMPSKTILTITGPEQSRDDLRLAAQLCEEIGGHLSVIVTSFAAPPQIGEYAAMVSDAWLQEREGDLARLAARTKEVAALLAEAPVSVDISSAYPELRWGDDVIGRRARYADVTLLGPELLASETLREKSIEGTLFSSGRPLLLVPFGASPTMKPNCVMVGWDSCLELSRAVREALDLIAAAAETHIVLVDPIKGELYHGDEPGADLAAYLTRHGANVIVERVPSENRSVTEVLKDHATAISADLLVLGAYGHSRFREYFFGGVTRSLLDDPFMPTFMAR